jgi:hypothetical protein
MVLIWYWPLGLPSLTLSPTITVLGDQLAANSLSESTAVLCWVRKVSQKKRKSMWPWPDTFSKKNNKKNMDQNLNCYDELATWLGRWVARWIRQTSTNNPIYKKTWDWILPPSCSMSAHLLFWSSVNENVMQVNKMRGIYTMECYSILRRKEGNSDTCYENESWGHYTK